jgi:hypothetical protein
LELFDHSNFHVFLALRKLSLQLRDSHRLIQAFFLLIEFSHFIGQSLLHSLVGNLELSHLLIKSVDLMFEIRHEFFEVQKACPELLHRIKLKLYLSYFGFV